jgi:hypothetical protein
MKMITRASKSKVDRVQVSGREIAIRELQQVRGGTIIVPVKPPATPWPD